MIIFAVAPSRNRRGSFCKEGLSCLLTFTFKSNTISIEQFIDTLPINFCFSRYSYGFFPQRSTALCNLHLGTTGRREFRVDSITLMLVQNKRKKESCANIQTVVELQIIDSFEMQKQSFQFLSNLLLHPVGDVFHLNFEPHITAYTHTHNLQKQ